MKADETRKMRLRWGPIKRRAKWVVVAMFLFLYIDGLPWVFLGRHTPAALCSGVCLEAAIKGEVDAVGPDLRRRPS